MLFLNKFITLNGTYDVKIKRKFVVNNKQPIFKLKNYILTCADTEVDYKFKCRNIDRKIIYINSFDISFDRYSKCYLDSHFPILVEHILCDKFRIRLRRPKTPSFTEKCEEFFENNLENILLHTLNLLLIFSLFVLNKRL